MPLAAAKFTFPESRRLKSSLGIKNIVAQRNSVYEFPIKCFYELRSRTSTESDIRVAMLVSKRRFKHAVDRNRVKRLLREAFRLHCNQLSIPQNVALDLCWMFIGKGLPDFKQVESAAESIFASLQTIIENSQNDEKNP